MTDDQRNVRPEYPRASCQLHSRSSLEPGGRSLDASVIILGYNGRQYVDGCLGSVLDQDLAGDSYEVIWADNASQDGSLEHVQAHFPTVRVLEFDTNYGFSEGNNRAAREARGRYLVFLNQDTVVHHHWLRALVTTLDSHPEMAACQANILMPWHPGFETFERHAFPDQVRYQDLDGYGCIVYRTAPMQKDPVPCTILAGACFIIRRSLVERLPFVFDARFFSYNEDMDLSLRLRALGHPVAVAPRAVMYHLQYSRVSSIRGAIGKAHRTARNRFIAHYKVTPTASYLARLPRMFYGGTRKLKELHLGRWREGLYMLAMVPISAAALVSAFWFLVRQGGRDPQRDGLRLGT